MATGDQNDMRTRLRNYLPSRWFSDDAPILDALLDGFAQAFAGIYDLAVYARAQIRITTASDGWLDLIAADFYGSSLTRRTNEKDDSLRASILADLFRERNTREAVWSTLLRITGHEPIIFEPARPLDTGAYDASVLAYNQAGGYGEILTAQAFITAYRPLGSGIPLVAGYDTSATGYDAGRGEYIDDTMYDGVSPDSTILAALETVRPAGVTLWVQMLDYPLSDPVVVRTGPRVRNVLGKVIVARKNGF